MEPYLAVAQALEGRLSQLAPCEVAPGREVKRRRRIEKSLEKRCALVIAEANGQPAGFVLARVYRMPGLSDQFVGSLSDLSVAEGQPRQEVSAALHAEASRWMKQKRAVIFNASALVADEETMGFWQSLGYQPSNLHLRKKLGSHLREKDL